MFKSKKQKLKEECWNLDIELIKWLNKHLKVYLKDAGKTIDLDFFKYEYNGKMYTQRQIIQRLIDITNYLMHADDIAYDIINGEELIQHHKISDSNKDEMYDLLKLVHWQLNW